jgi:ribosomal protein S18 acetylase RimI-like enzyme
MSPDLTTKLALEISLKVAAAPDVDVLLSMMEVFNAGELIKVAPHALRPALEQLLADGALGRVWLIQFGTETVGYAVLTFGYALEFAGRDAFITELFLSPPARGRGIGRVALARIEAASLELGVQAIHLMVRPENRPAVALYASAGYAAPPRAFLSKVLAKKAIGEP